ncbi:LysR family transcriptional regulator [Fusobacterium perfoetens]|uniref:LysR family transcriptional regulator n=1 Tax=Fusobacterium perfoetens TaxID=852 RepID=UPI00047FF505|nr:LysR family transcriptional regulator [Fusobacterium perfoetens]MCI6151779.1 LysR family transcriptional regulator [Fusobacterium perfoetens]MDY3236860.1 LysR family transcriptional regulator [Fusobacterium perfoetens]
MTLKDMEYVFYIAQFKNFSKAAEHLFISQSALSQSINKLEDELGLQLFRRTSKGVSLTYAGEFFLKESEKIISEVKILKEKLEGLSSCKKRTLGIGVFQFYGRYFLPKIIPEFRKLFPDVQIKIIEDSPYNLEKILLEDEVDLVISAFVDFNPKLIYKKIVTEDILLAVPKTNPITSNIKDEFIDLSSFKDENFILLMKGIKARKNIDKICESLNFNLNCILETKDFETVNSLVSKNLGVGFVPGSVEKLEGVVYYKIRNSYSQREFFIAYKKNTQKPYIISEFTKLALLSINKENKQI